MEGYLQTGLGIIVSLILFVIGYRQTIGAKKERAKNANSSITRAIMKRMVLENYSPIYKDITRVIEGKAREFKVSVGDLLAEEQVLNSLFTEVFDSDLISPSQRVDIEDRINAVLNETEKEPIKATISDFRQYKAEKESRKESLTAMVLSASLLGTLFTFMYSFYQTETIETDFLFSALIVLVGSVAIITALTTYRKSIEVETVSSKSSAAILANRFETDVAKVLTKSKFKFAIEPRIGQLRPDFIVNLDGKKIAIEAKSWNGAVPLRTLRTTNDYLNKLVALDTIDEAILVTHKNDNIPRFVFEDERVSVVSINELASKLKNVA